MLWLALEEDAYLARRPSNTGKKENAEAEQAEQQQLRVC